MWCQVKRDHCCSLMLCTRNTEKGRNPVLDRESEIEVRGGGGEGKRGLNLPRPLKPPAPALCRWLQSYTPHIDIACFTATPPTSFQNPSGATQRNTVQCICCCCWEPCLVFGVIPWTLAILSGENTSTCLHFSFYNLGDNWLAVQMIDLICLELHYNYGKDQEITQICLYAHPW